MDEILQEWLRTSQGDDFILIVADRVCGVHDGKGEHRPAACRISGSTVEIDFDGSERLAIIDAAGMEVLPEGELILANASEVRFSWRPVDQPDGGALPCEEVFRIQGRYFDFCRTGAPFNTQISLVYMDQYLVRLRPVKTKNPKD